MKKEQLKKQIKAYLDPDPMQQDLKSIVNLLEQNRGIKLEESFEDDLVNQLLRTVKKDPQVLLQSINETYHKSKYIVPICGALVYKLLVYTHNHFELESFLVASQISRRLLYLEGKTENTFNEPKLVDKLEKMVQNEKLGISETAILVGQSANVAVIINTSHGRATNPCLSYQSSVLLEAGYRFYNKLDQVQRFVQELIDCEGIPEFLRSEEKIIGFAKAMDCAMFIDGFKSNAFSSPWWAVKREYAYALERAASYGLDIDVDTDYALTGAAHTSLESIIDGVFGRSSVAAIIINL